MHDGREQSSPCLAHCSSWMWCWQSCFCPICWCSGWRCDSPLHSPCSEPRKKRSCLHHSILSHPVQAVGGQAPPVSSHSSEHTGCKNLGLHSPSWELHCNTATSQLLLGPHLRATNTVLTSQQSLPRREFREQVKVKRTTPLLVLPVKLNSGLIVFLFQQENK